MNIWIPVLMGFGGMLMLVNFFLRKWLVALTVALVFAGLFWEILGSITLSTNPTQTNPLWLVAYGVAVLVVGNVLFAVARLMGGGQGKNRY